MNMSVLRFITHTTPTPPNKVGACGEMGMGGGGINGGIHINGRKISPQYTLRKSNSILGNFIKMHVNARMGRGDHGRV